MPEPYEELIGGEWLLRLPPRPSHEAILDRLHAAVGRCLATLRSSTLLPPRSQVSLGDQNRFRPDLSLVATATGKLWLAVEIINQEDHHADTVLKKTVYEELRLPRLWIVDPRYENVEVYHGTPHGLALRETLMVKETLAEPLLPGFAIPVTDLFSSPGSPGTTTRHDF
jgi:Uma2 family endonuclease